MMVDFKKYGCLHNCAGCTEWDGQECRQGLRMECLHERCEDCPHWTGMECDGDLVTEEWARRWMAEQGENSDGMDAILDGIDRIEDLTPDKFMAICRDYWDR